MESMWKEIVYLQLILTVVFHKEVVSCFKISEFPALLKNGLFWIHGVHLLWNKKIHGSFFLWKHPLVWQLKIINVATCYQYIFDFYFAS